MYDKRIILAGIGSFAILMALIGHFSASRLLANPNSSQE
jgi:hypothetical protein